MEERRLPPALADTALTPVATGLVPVAPITLVLRPPKRDGRDKPGHDKSRDQIQNQKGAEPSARRALQEPPARQRRERPGPAGPRASCAPLRPSSEVLPGACAAAPRMPSDRSAGRHRPWRNRRAAAAAR